MKLYLLAFSALTLIPSLAIAADPVAPFSPNWSGFYVGAQIGTGSVNSKLSGFDESGTGNEGDPGNIGAWGPLAFPYAGTVVGGFVGYNKQIDRIVLGIEADANKPFGASSGANITEDLYPGPGGMFSVKSKWDASIRARVGVLLNERTLAYATGGVAFGAIDAFGGEEVTKSSYYEIYPNWGAGTNIGGGPRVGYTVGGGLEYALDNNWKIRGEYRYTDYGTARTNYIYDPAGANTPGYVDHQMSENRFTLGASYTFSGEPTKSLGSGDYESHDWSGVHIGSQIGVSSSTTKFAGYDNNGGIGGGDSNGAWNLADLNNMSVMHGLTLGYDAQMQKLIFGIEADANLNSGSANAYVTEDRYPGPGGLWSVNSNWNASIRARLGYAVGERAMIYGTAGLALANISALGGMEPANNSNFYERYPNWGNQDIGGGTRLGVTAGAGLEYALDSNWSLKGEYRFSDYGTSRLDYALDPTKVDCTNCTGHVDNHIFENRILVGLNYKLGGGGKTIADSARSTWSGFHIGGAVGASRNLVNFSGYDQNSNDKFINNMWGTDEPINFSLAGTNLGAYAGYDYQLSNFVLGIEADANHTSGASENGRLQEQDNPGNGQWNVSSNWNASIRARAGYLATDNVLTYVTGGLAYSNVQTTTGFEVFNGTAQTPPWGFGDIGGGDRLGLTYGGGLEYALSEDMTLRMEYRHTDYNSKTIHYDSKGTDATITNKSNEDRVSVGMSYKF